MTASDFNTFVVWLEVLLQTKNQIVRILLGTGYDQRHPSRSMFHVIRYVQPQQHFTQTNVGLRSHHHAPGIVQNYYCCCDIKTFTLAPSMTINRRGKLNQ